MEILAVTIIFSISHNVLTCCYFQISVVKKGGNSLTKNKILDWSILKALADKNSMAANMTKFVLNSVEYIGKQHLLLFSQCFHMASFSGLLTLSQTTPCFYLSAVQTFRKHCGKRRNCVKRAISPFPSVFSTLLRDFSSFSSDLESLSTHSFNLEESKICLEGIGRKNTGLYGKEIKLSATNLFT